MESPHSRRAQRVNPARSRKRHTPSPLPMVVSALSGLARFFPGLTDPIVGWVHAGARRSARAAPRRYGGAPLRGKTRREPRVKPDAIVRRPRALASSVSQQSSWLVFWITR